MDWQVQGHFSLHQIQPELLQSLFSPTKGKTLSGDQGVQGGPQLEVGRWLPLPPTARRAPVSRPGGVLTADSSPWTGSLRSPPAPPTQGAPRRGVLGVSLETNSLVFPAQIATSAPWLPKVTHRESSLPATRLGGSQRQKHACSRQSAGASGSKGGRELDPGLMQLPIPGAGRFPGPRRAGSVAHPPQVPRLQPGPRGRSWRRWAGVSASRWAPMTSQHVPEP